MDLDAQKYSEYTLVNRRPRHRAVNPPVGGVILWVLPLPLLFALAIVSCGKDKLDARGSDQPNPATLMTQVLATPHTETTTPLPSSTETLNEDGCAEKTGNIVRDQIVDSSLIRPLPYRIYLPPCYSEDDPKRYPSLYMLHGLASDDSQWDELGIDEQADALIASGAAKPFLIIMPHHATGIDLETATIDVLVPFIDRQYHAYPDPRYRSIGGLSRGGGLALRIGLHHPDVFRSIGLHSPANPYSRPLITQWVSDMPGNAYPNIWIDIGDTDPLLKTAQELIDILEGLDLTLTSTINPGYHDSAYWTEQMESYLRWYVDHWPSTP